MTSDTPRHLRIETYYLNEIQHVKNHVLGMIELADPEWLSGRLDRGEDWERLTRSFEGQFQILFGSLELIRSQVGDTTYDQLVVMGREAKTLFETGDERAAAFRLQDMDQLGWSKRSQRRKGNAVAQN